MVQGDRCYYASTERTWVTPLTPDQERYAEASAIYRQHGDGARVWVAARIGALARLNDQAGIRRMTEIAARLDEIMRATRQ